MMMARNRLVFLMAEHTLKTGEPLTVTKVAKATKISRETLYSYIHQKTTRFDARVLGSLCHYFNVGIEKLIEIDPPIDAEVQQ